MKKIFLLVSLALLLSISNVRAESQVDIEVVDKTTTTNDTLKEITQKDKQEIVDERFSYEIEGDDDYMPTSSPILPDCNDERLLGLVKHHIEAYQNRYPAQTIVGRRKQALMVKSLSKFEEVSSEGVTSKDDYKLANELIMLKMKEYVSAMDIKVCKGPKGFDNTDLYVVVFAKGNVILGRILNFAEKGAQERDLELIY